MPAAVELLHVASAKCHWRMSEADHRSARWRIARYRRHNLLNRAECILVTAKLACRRFEEQAAKATPAQRQHDNQPEMAPQLSVMRYSGLRSLPAAQPVASRRRSSNTASNASDTVRASTSLQTDL